MSIHEYARRGAAGGLRDLRSFLRSPSADDLLDAAVCGYLSESWADEIARDYGLDLERPRDRATFRREINAALAEGC